MIKIMYHGVENIEFGPEGLAVSPNLRTLLDYDVYAASSLYGHSLVCKYFCFTITRTRRKKGEEEEQEER